MGRTLTKKHRRRAFPRVVVRMNVRNQSSRNGAPILLITVHSTESHNRPGKGDLLSIGNYFDTAGVDASSHVVVDSDELSGRLVPDSQKAWTQAFWNPYCLSIEQIGRAGMKWSSPEVRESARWVAQWSRKHKIPIRIGKVTQNGVVLRTGVISHKALGARGGGHHDPGRYPWKALLRWARIYRALQIDRLKRNRD